jgi:FkbM family methyltransferase
MTCATLCRVVGRASVPRWWNTRRFDLLELSCVILVVALACWHLGRSALLDSLVPVRSTLEGHALAAAYGPGRNSQHEEEWVIRDFFRDRRGGVFVDVGANDYRVFSNTFYLETQLGWSGIAVDPQVRFEGNYRKYRPRTRFFALFVGDTSQENATIHVLEHDPLVASASREFTGRWGRGAKEVEVPTITLTDLLDQVGMTHLDLLSIDVELAEPKVLTGFDVERFKPAFVCIEAQREVRQQILDYFAKHMYVPVGNYLRVDQDNLYFVPLE